VAEFFFIFFLFFFLLTDYLSDGQIFKGDSSPELCTWNFCSSE